MLLKNQSYENNTKFALIIKKNEHSKYPWDNSFVRFTVHVYAYQNEYEVRN